MRKALLIVALAASLSPLQPAEAINRNVTITIQYPTAVSPVPGGDYSDPGVITAPCVTGGIQDQYTCQKSTAFRVARCYYLLNPLGDAQSGNTGKVGFIAKINAAAVRGNLDDDRDNNTFNLTVTNKLNLNQGPPLQPPVPLLPTGDNIGGTRADLPDVDVAFYANIGACQSDIETIEGGPVVEVGPAPIELKSNTIVRSTYKSYGDEIAGVFPNGKYEDPDDPTSIKIANTYFAVITIVGGTGANIEFRCRDKVYIGPNRDCGTTWFST